MREAHPADEQGTPLLVHEGLAGVVVKAIVPVTEGGGVDGGVWCLGAHETPVLPHEIEDRALHGEVACGMDVLAGKPLRIVGISFYINSPGGSVSAGLAIYDTMRYIKPEVSTICVGMAASMGAILLGAGAKGKRFALPNSEIMVHQPLGGISGQAEDIKIHADHILKTREKLNKILAQATGRTMEQISGDTDRDNYLSAEEALEFGIIDKVIESR